MEVWDYGPTTWDSFSDDNRAYILKVARAALLVADADDAVADRMVDVFLREMGGVANDSDVDQGDVDRALAALTSADRNPDSTE